MRYVKEMGLNTIRLEGKFENNGFFRLGNEHGILIMPGFECINLFYSLIDKPMKN